MPMATVSPLHPYAVKADTGLTACAPTYSAATLNLGRIAAPDPHI